MSNVRVGDIVRLADWLIECPANYEKWAGVRGEVLSIEGSYARVRWSFLNGIKAVTEPLEYIQRA